MPRYCAILSYDGTYFSGWQNQPNQRTVQGELEKAVNKMAKDPVQFIKVYGSGRTDAGVHALGQVAHFDLPFIIPSDGVRKGLSTMLPFDIEVKKVERVDSDFHAQYSVHTKTYLYRLLNRPFRDPFRRNYTGYWPRYLDIDKIELAINDYLGEHDWIGFAAAGFQAKTTVRTVTNVEFINAIEQEELIFEFTGTGFLYNQIRIMVGVLLEIGSGKRPVNDITRLLVQKDRQQARLTAPASGLYLKSVDY